MSATHLGSWQPSLFEAATPHPDLSFEGVVRHRLDDTAWVDQVSGWLHSPDALFDWLLDNAAWHTEEIVIHGRRMVQPRLLARWSCGDEDPRLPAPLARLRGAVDRTLRASLQLRGRQPLQGRSRQRRVAWGPYPANRPRSTGGHPHPGGAATFPVAPRWRPHRADADPGAGDLLVMGGTSQRTWQHTIPKVAAAGPRISVTFRHSTNDAVPATDG